MTRPPDRAEPRRPDDELRFGYLIHDVSRLRRTLFDRWLAPAGITRSQWWVLAFLARGDGMPQTALADELDIGKVALGALVDRLEGGGFVQRRPAPADRRVKLVFLAPKGRALLDTLRLNSRAFNERILAGISDQDIRTAIETLGHIKGNLVGDADAPAMRHPGA